MKQDVVFLLLVNTRCCLFHARAYARPCVCVGVGVGVGVGVYLFVSVCAYASVYVNVRVCARGSCASKRSLWRRAIFLLPLLAKFEMVIGVLEVSSLSQSRGRGFNPGLARQLS